ncbi:hypothetical protein [Hymenobacter sp. GOD-10R]|uniref:hypothetical protein n=1 Tax=Hymenobacter sp. GOD-10R TaxID=3093922 RepID=UPI002D77E6C0|nr:hypothetical protein [Hymenobacter sp. GOD-10R]WRQ28334.1 hypothetical protein SD425_25015 [Hymenobacter sp. GOD-10R]
MKQREVIDAHHTTWTCVQAYAGLEGKVAEQAAKLAETADGQVTVVCTPNGGAQTVRLELNSNWLDNLSDEELLQAIAEAR